MRRTFPAILLCLLLCLCMLPVGILATSAASASVDYLALGDSISTGCALPDRNNGYTFQIAREGGYSLTVGATDGFTSTNLKQQVTSHSLDAQIANAELITITIGGNDLMGALFQAIADRAGVSVGEVQSNLTNYLFHAMIVLADPVSTEALQNTLALYESNIYGPGGVLEYIRARNSSAMIVMLTQYNPYKNFTGLYSILSSGADKAMVVLNDLIKSKASQFHYTVSDVYTVFKNDSRNLCNASSDTMNLDVHPNQDGHNLIKTTVQQTIRESCGSHVYVNKKCALCGTGATLVTFVGNGGGGSMPQAAITAGAYTLPQNGFTAPRGLQFKAWLVNGEEYLPGVSVTISTHTTVQAVWTPAALTGTLKVSGTARLGETLTATYTGGNNTGEIYYWWYRSGESDRLISGANESTYTLTGEDVGQQIYCVVTSSVQTDSRTSAKTEAVAKGLPSYTLPTGLQATYGQTLADVALPEGFAWENALTTGVGNAGNNRIEAVFTPADTALYDTVTVEVTVAVAKAPLTVTAEDKTVEQYAAFPTFTYTVTGWVGQDAFTKKPVASVSVSDTKNHGQYEIAFSGATNANYEITYVAGTLTVTEHTVHTEGSAPTCTSPAVCALCKAGYGEALSHRMTFTAATEATCTEDGNHPYYTCSTCERRYEDEQGSTAITAADCVIPALGHNTGDEWKSDAEKHWQTCLACGEDQPAAAHVPGPEATEQNAQTCTACGYVLVEALGHSFGEAWLGDESNHWHACACGEKDSVAPHTWNAGTVTREPTAEEAGEKVYACTVCGYEKTEAITLSRGCNGSVSGVAAILPLLCAIPVTLWPRKKED